jgi:hypothetical protein
MRFLLEKKLKDFYWKVIFPAVTYGIVMWGKLQYHSDEDTRKNAYKSRQNNTWTCQRYAV